MYIRFAKQNRLDSVFYRIEHAECLPKLRLRVEFYYVLLLSFILREKVTSPIHLAVAFILDWEQSLFSSKIRGEECKTSKGVSWTVSVFSKHLSSHASRKNLQTIFF